MDNAKMVYEILSKVKIGNKILLTLNGDVLSQSADNVIIDGKKYEYEIAYDLPNSIGVCAESIESDIVEFM